MLFTGISLIFTGIYLAIHETKSSENSELRELEFFNIKIRVSRPMLFIILGITSMISPVLLQTFHNTGAFDFPSATASESEFGIIDDVRIFDLSNHFFVDKKSAGDNTSKVRQTRYLRLVKNPGVNEIRYRFSTSGVNLSINCLTHESKVQTLDKNEDSTIAQTQNLKIEKEIMIDVSNQEPGEEFVIITEALYENAFQGKVGDRAGAVTKQPTGRLGIKLVFADKNINRNYSLKTIDKLTDKKIQYEGTEKVNASDILASWTINNPEMNKPYLFYWTWNQEI